MPSSSTGTGTVASPAAVACSVVELIAPGSSTASVSRRSWRARAAASPAPAPCPRRRSAGRRGPRRPAPGRGRRRAPHAAGARHTGRRSRRPRSGAARQTSRTAHAQSSRGASRRSGTPARKSATRGFGGSLRVAAAPAVRRPRHARHPGRRAGPAGQVALGVQLGVTLLDQAAGQPERAGQFPRGRQLLPLGQPPGPDRRPELVFQLRTQPRAAVPVDGDQQLGTQTGPLHSHGTGPYR